MPTIISISDTHNHTIEIPDGDILIHAGDFSSFGYRHEVEKFLTWFDGLPHLTKILISGNHDFMCQEKPDLFQTYIDNTDTVDYLCDSGVEREGLKIWGSPWQPYFYDWAWNLKTERELQEKWDLIPDDTDIVVTHGPPQYLGDTTLDKLSVGSRSLRETLLGRVQPLVHVCGHIHSGYGLLIKDGTTFVNASTCNEKYQAVNKPIVIEL